MEYQLITQSIKESARKIDEENLKSGNFVLTLLSLFLNAKL